MLDSGFGEIFCFVWKSAATRKVHSILQAMMMKGCQKDRYSLARTSEDDLSKDGLLETERKFYQRRPSFWRRHRNMVLVQVVFLIVYKL